MASQISPEEIEQYKKAFSVFDKDGDGKISTEDLKAVLGSLGHMPSQAMLEDIMHEVDNDGNGTIELDEFLEMMNSKIDFTESESDKSGFITASVLQEVMTNIGDKLTYKEAEDMIEEIDTDGDGKVTFDDFQDMMTKE
ncbi:hypothetical protein ACJMK2_017886 [Sinanodonta woodiana]|uniref:EF-hand domain-containing protein n=1 Tax=Sinanodonta woodiana TaxID=1069815 RepID=A0ABD3UDS6_SINWO